MQPRPKSASELAARLLPVNGPVVAASAAGPSRGFSREFRVSRIMVNNVVRYDN